MKRTNYLVAALTLAAAVAQAADLTVTGDLFTTGDVRLGDSDATVETITLWGNLKLNEANSWIIGGEASSSPGANTISWGASAHATGANSFAFGNNVTASGARSVAIGLDNAAQGNNSFVAGTGSIASGTTSFAFGNTTTAQRENSVSGGLGTVADSYAMFVIGRYNTTDVNRTNAWNGSEPVFVIGNGTGTAAASRADAFVVNKNGNTTINGTLTLSGAATLSSSLTVTGNITGNGTNHQLPNQILNHDDDILTWGLANTKYVQLSGNGSIAGNLTVTGKGAFNLGTGIASGNGLTTSASYTGYTSQQNLAEFSATAAPTATNAEAIAGLQATATKTGNQTITRGLGAGGGLRGMEAWAINSGSATVTAASAISGTVKNTSTGTTSSGIAVMARTPIADSTGKIGDAYGLYVEEQNPGSSVVSGKGFGVYAAGTTNFNVLVGKTRIGGTGDPDVALDVTGAAEISTTLDVTGNITGSGGNNQLTGQTTANDAADILTRGLADGIYVTQGGNTDISVVGDGSVPLAPTAAGVYLGRHGTSSHRRVEIVAAAGGNPYIDFTTPNTDFEGRLLYNSTSDQFELKVGGTNTLTASDSLLNVTTAATYNSTLSTTGDLSVTGGGTVSTSPSAAGIYLAKTAGSENRRIEIVAGAGYSGIIDFTTPNVDREGRIHYDTVADKMAFEVGGANVVELTDGLAKMVADATVAGKLSSTGDVSVTGGGTIPDGPTAAGIFLAKNSANSGRRLEIVSAANTSGYIDFTTPNVDREGRISYNTQTDKFGFEVGGTDVVQLSAGTANFIGNIQGDGSNNQLPGQTVADNDADILTKGLGDGLYVKKSAGAVSESVTFSGALAVRNSTNSMSLGPTSGSQRSFAFNTYRYGSSSEGVDWLSADTGGSSTAGVISIGGQTGSRAMQTIQFNLGSSQSATAASKMTLDYTSGLTLNADFTGNGSKNTLPLQIALDHADAVNGTIVTRLNGDGRYVKKSAGTVSESLTFSGAISVRNSTNSMSVGPTSGDERSFTFNTYRYGSSSEAVDWLSTTTGGSDNAGVISIGGQASGRAMQSIQFNLDSSQSATTATSRMTLDYATGLSVNADFTGHGTKNTLPSQVSLDDAEAENSSIVTREHGDARYVMRSGPVNVGSGNNVTGTGSTGVGSDLTVTGAQQFVIGRFNDNPSSASSTEWQETDPLFVIGNGVDENSPSNAVTVLKNGNATFARNVSLQSQLILGKNNLEPVVSEPPADTDELIIVGNGVDAENLSNALVVKRNGFIQVGEIEIDPVSNTIRIPESGDVPMGEYQ